ncbi:PAS domain-containing protein [Massilia forsythiae]|uniref:histidine kinase n=2 Tax=Massilia forsythiae TaxID=2728020 RepID=A0A7Z2ZR75_9BURK|nr:PAS domain-containing protein [Massilia forsythiae]
MRYDDQGRPADYRFLEVNPAFAQHTGLQDAAGRWMRNLVPEHEQYWFDRYAAIARSGQPARFEYTAQGLGGRHFEVYAYRTGQPGKHHVAILFSDVSARKREEMRRAALFALNDRLAQLDDTASMTDAACTILGETLDVQLVGYGVVDAEAETLTVERDWTTGGAPSLAGTVQFRDFGSYIEDFKRGDTVVVRDARLDPRTRDFAAALEARSARAFVNTPVFERGRFVALQYVSTAFPRDWSEDELLFIRDVAGRTRAATARVQAESALRRLAASLEQQVQARARELDRAWELSQELLVVALPDGTIDAINPMWTQVLGYEAPDIVGTSFVEFTHPDDLDATLGVFAGMLDRPLTVPYAYRFRHKDGSYRWIAWTGAFNDGKVYAAGRDVTVERQREKALRDAETFTRLALNSVGGVGAWSADLQNGIYFCDAAIGELYGLDPARIADGIPIAEFFAYIHPEDLPLLKAEIARHLSSDKEMAWEYRLQHPDGRVRSVLSRWRNHHDEHGVAVRRTGVGIETTGQRNLEEQLRQAQKMEAVGQLTGGLAHDFNNLLAGITGALDLMQMRMRQGRFGDLERYMTVAQGAARRAAALTHRLLAFSRRQTLDPKPTDVNRLVSGMEELVRRTIGPQIALETVGAVGLWPTLIDPGQLENSLLNLCINARDAMPDGGRITIETANKWLDQAASIVHDIPEGQYLSLCVTDTGTGMTPDIVAKVFEPFFTTKPIGEGTGLGLSMIHGFARQSGGQVRIYSEVGQGTTVCLYLPRHYGEAGADDAGRGRTEVARAGQGETVLVVDDEPSVRMLVTEVLEDLGYTAIEAADSVAGLKVLQSDARIDLLVTDVGLPGGMNGRQMADAGRERRPGLKVLFITGYAENSLIGNGHLKPGMQVLTKPFAVDLLGAKIKELIAAR